MRIMKAQKRLMDVTFYSKIRSLMKPIENFHFPKTDFKTVKSPSRKPWRLEVSKETGDQESQNAEIKYKYKEVVKGEEWKT